jgi:hypothetical protein
MSTSGASLGLGVDVAEVEGDSVAMLVLELHQRVSPACWGPCRRRRTIPPRQSSLFKCTCSHVEVMDAVDVQPEAVATPLPVVGMR